MKEAGWVITTPTMKRAGLLNAAAGMFHKAGQIREAGLSYWDAAHGLPVGPIDALTNFNSNMTQAATMFKQIKDDEAIDGLLADYKIHIVKFLTNPKEIQRQVLSLERYAGRRI